MIKKHLEKDYVPFILLACATAITGIVYTSTSDDPNTLTYLKLISTAFIPLIFPITKLLFRIRVPLKLNALVTLHVFCAIHLGSCFAFYSLISWWDLYLHGLFGFIGAALILELIPCDRFNGTGGVVLSMLLTVLSTLGLGALWEIFEFTTDIITGADAQCVKEALANGKNPLGDTVEDLIITVIGSIFYVIFIVVLRKINKKENIS